MLARILSGPPAPPEKSKSGIRGATPASAGSYRQAVCPTCGHLCEVGSRELEALEAQRAEQAKERKPVVVKRADPRRR